MKNSRNVVVGGGGGGGEEEYKEVPVESAEELYRRLSGNVEISKKSLMTYYL